MAITPRCPHVPPHYVVQTGRAYLGGTAMSLNLLRLSHFGTLATRIAAAAVVAAAALGSLAPGLQNRPMASASSVSPFAGQVASVGPTLTGPAVPNKAPPVDLKPLQTQLKTYLASQQGTYGVYVIDLLSGKSAGVNANTVFPTASTFKLPLAMYLLNQAEQKKLSLDDVIIYTTADWEDGTGILQDSQEGDAFKVRRLIELAITESDNIATNMLLRRFGRDNVYAYMQTLGAKVTKYDADTNGTTPREMATLMRSAISAKALPDARLRRQLLDWLEHTAFDERTAAGVPVGIRVAHKIGTLPGVVNDIAVVYAPQRTFVVSVYSMEVDEAVAPAVIAEITRRVYNFEVGLQPSAKGVAHLRPRPHPQRSGFLLWKDLGLHWQNHLGTGQSGRHQRSGNCLLQRIKTDRLLPVIIAASFLLNLSFGAYRSVFNNFAVDELDISAGMFGLLEGIREIPGLLSILLIALAARMRDERVYAISGGLIGAGIWMYASAHSYMDLVFATLVQSSGFHMWSVIQDSLVIRAVAQDDRARRLGQINSVAAAATVIGMAVVLTSQRWVGLRSFFIFAGIAGIVGGAVALFMRPPRAHQSAVRFVFRARYQSYYVLTLLSGARRHIVLTFASFALVKLYGASVQTMATLLIVHSILAVFTRPAIGRIIDRVGEQRALSLNYAIVAAVFLGYALIRSPIFVYGLFIADNLLTGFDIAISTHAGRIIPREELSASLATGSTINHIFGVTVPVVGGLLWEWFGPVVPFVMGAAIVLVAMAYSWNLDARTARALAGLPTASSQ